MSKTALIQYINDTLDGNEKPVPYYLELEKQQLIDAYTTGAFDLFHEICNHSNCTLKAEQYYNLKFKDNEI